jgi:hypothetical protein
VNNWPPDDRYLAPSYATPEAAIRAEAASWHRGPPERFRAVVDYHEDLAFAVAAAEAVAADDGGRRLDPETIEEGVYRRRADGRWESEGGGSGGGVGWRTTSLDEAETGVLALTGIEPDGASAVVVRWRGEDHTVPIRDGLVLFTAWDEPPPADPDEGLMRRMHDRLHELTGMRPAEQPIVEYAGPADPELDSIMQQLRLAAGPVPAIVAVIR